MSRSLSLDAPLDNLLDQARSRYDVRFEPVTIDGQTLEILQIADLEALLDRLVATAGTGPIELPYWAKIWPAAMLLAHFLPHLGPGEGRSLLELGAGLGICGLFAAKRGFRTLITDIHPDALLFAKINILQNGLADTADVARADFSADRLGRRFDVVLGAEVLYLEDLYRGLSKFLLAHLAADPAAEVVLAKDYTRKATRFLGLADREFHIAERVVGYKETNPENGEPERKLCQIFRLRPRKQA
ncbi:MAG: class I SAM-dependent methyltransferase [Solidesulfovibrio sp. DCME]|uniref:class I SAM-dependent methyltransferase n=1 Tax=Solidesulfovibrio sp. DCME TaxID=3447380 RepID=UPI003D1307F2